MYRLNRDESCKKALRDSIFSNGHSIISLENVSRSKRTKMQNYEVLYNGYVDHDTIRAEFNFDFEEYQLNPGRSYVKITSIRAVHNTLDNIFGIDHPSNTLCAIVVKYCGDYRPYSGELSHSQLVHKNDELCKIIDSWKTAYLNLYLRGSKKEECPVCYCDLHQDNLELPICTHGICKSCFTKCDKCPLCRTSYL